MSNTIFHNLPTGDLAEITYTVTESAGNDLTPGSRDVEIIKTVLHFEPGLDAEEKEYATAEFDAVDWEEEVKKELF